MCGVCGCAGDGATIEGEAHRHAHDHHHDHDGHHHHDHHHHYHAVAGKSDARLVQVERDLLERNAQQARRNRAHFAAHRVLALNIVSSPGAGKTSLLVETIKRLGKARLAVVEGDQQTSLDADRIRATGARAVQVNTGKGCHLDADMVDRAFGQLHHDVEDGILFIENVGNLVCPAGFDLGETHRIVIASVTEGDDKPLKYPDIFASADLMIVSKADIAEACGSNVADLIANARRVKPDLPALVLSSRSGEGMERWLAWLNAAVAMRQAVM